MSKSIETKFGHAYIDRDGYYTISRNYTHKFLHRVIFADFYGLDDIDEFFDEHMEIHHNDGNPLNNEIWNLIPLTPSEHRSLHMKGVPLSEEHKRKLSKAHKGVPKSEEHKRNRSLATTITGIHGVSKMKSPTCKQGFRWRYKRSLGSKQKEATNVDLVKLMQKVKKTGLSWNIIDEEKFLKTCIEYNYNPDDLR